MKLFFESEFPVRGIDPDNGIVKGATLCVANVAAKGHQLETDKTLLRQLLMSAQSKGVIPVGLDHKSGVKGAAGAAKNFRISGDRLLADISFFKSHPDFGLVMDQLQELGGTMGLSCSFVGESEAGKARCSDLLSADLTLHPAACPTGLFSRRDFDALNENSDQNESTEDIPMNEMNEDQLAGLLHELLDHVEDLTSHIEQIEAENAAMAEALEALQGDDEDADDEEDAADDAEPVLSERGAMAGPHVHNHSADLRTYDFESAIEENRRAGMDPKKAHVEALKQFARQKYQMLNL